jgi:hypothetical protein
MSTPPKRRGPKRLATITYQDLSEWTGLSLGTIRNRAAELQGLDVRGLIRWAERHKRRGYKAIVSEATQQEE